MRTEADYANYEKVQNIIIKYAPGDDGKDADAAGMLKAIGELETISYMQAMEMMGDVADAIGQCKSASLPAKTAKSSTGSQSNADGSSTEGCVGLSQATINHLKTVAEDRGESLDDVCSRVSTSS